MTFVRRTLPFVAAALLPSFGQTAPQAACERPLDDVAPILKSYEGQASALGAGFLRAPALERNAQGVGRLQGWDARARAWSKGLSEYSACLEGDGCSLGALIRDEEKRDPALGAWMKALADDGLEAAVGRAGKAIALLDDATARLSGPVAAASSCFAAPAPSVSPAVSSEPVLDIDHKTVACVVADRFPRLDARLVPTEQVAVARVVFQGAGPEWYSVAMKSAAGVFSGTLPKPLKSLKTFHYYIEVTDRALGTRRTPDYTTSVVGRPGECGNGIVATALSAASVVLQGPAGIATLPAGFSPIGVIAGSAAGASTAGVATSSGAASAGAAGAGSGAAAAGGAAVAGGGLSAGAIVGIAAGVGGAAAVGAAASGGGDSTPAPTPTPTPCPACYAGQWTMQVTFTAIGPLCGNQEFYVVGQPRAVAPMTFAPDGRITFPSNLDICTGCTFTVNSAGNMRLDIPGDPPGRGTCPAGSGSGQCTSTRSCSGNATQGGDQISFVISR